MDRFDLKRDDIDRTATANIAAHALTTVRADGSRAIEMAKEARFVSNSGLEWIFESVGQASPYSPIETETTRIVLPAGALNAHVETIGSEPQQLVYQLQEANFNTLSSFMQVSWQLRPVWYSESWALSFRCVRLELINFR
jgi:hypothetical protein